MDRPERALLGVISLVLMAGGGWISGATAAEGETKVVGAAQAEALGAEVRRGYSLEQCIRMAERNYPEVQKSRAKVAYYRAQLDEARSAPFSQWKMTGGVALAPTARGTSVYSPDTDVALKSNMGLAWRVNVDGAIPLWTFGKISNLVDAAEQQVAMGEHEVRKHQNQVKLDVRKAYYGAQLARNSILLLRDAAAKLADAEAKLGGEGDDEGADPGDLYRMQLARLEIDARLAEAEKYERVAISGLRFLTGNANGFEIASDELVGSTHRLGPVLRYLQAAKLHRPEVMMAHFGLRAREAQVALARSKMYPDLGLGVGIGWTRAPEVDDQLNPFVKDNGNVVGLGFGLVFQWNLDFLPAYARVAQAQAELQQTQALERMALGGIGVEVEQAYAEVVQAQKRRSAYERSEKLAKKWLVYVQQGVDMGTEEEKGLLDPAKEYAQQRFNHLNAIMDLNVAVSKLALVTGWDEIAPGS